MARRDKSSMELPLVAWGDQLRARKLRRRTLARRAVIVGTGIVLIALTTVSPSAPRLVWNASASAPIGLYAVIPGAAVDPGDMVIARVPEAWRSLAAQRHYLPANVPLVKRVAAAGGDEVCELGPEIFINGNRAAIRRVADAKGRSMSWWSGCVRLHGRQLFLLMQDSPASFDGRYFGVTEGDEVIGRARLLWAR